MDLEGQQDLDLVVASCNLRKPLKMMITCAWAGDPRDTPSEIALRHQKGRLGTSPMYFRTEDSGFLGTSFLEGTWEGTPPNFSTGAVLLRYLCIYARVFGSFITL